MNIIELNIGGADLSVGQHPKLQDHGYGAIAPRCMPVYSLAFAGNH